MSYSIDLRKRVVEYVSKGGNQIEAVKIFGVNRRTIYNWLHRKNLSPTPAKTRKRKLDKAALLRHVQQHPDALLRERALHFAVHINAIWTALKKMDISNKKNNLLRAKTPRTTHGISARST